MMQEWILWTLCLAYVLWRSWNTLRYVRQNPSGAAKSFLFTGMLWIGLISYGVRFLQNQ